MIMMRKCFRVGICQYFPIFDDFYKKKNTVRERYLTKIKFIHAHNYVLFNYDELRHFIWYVQY